MKKILLLLSGILFSLAIQASLQFDSGKKYRIVCDMWGYGSITLGANHGSTAYVYYDASEKPADDSWWYIREDGNGYTICNALSGTYLTYYSERIENVAKGLILSTEATTNESHWTFTENGGSYCIINVASPEQWFNVRVDGTFLVGTYDSHTTKSNNEYFKFYDEEGNLVGGTEGGTTGKGNYGKTESGEYWECTGLETPVAYTTDTSNPIYYTIKNVRSGNSVYVESDYLYQDETSASKFYFVQTDNGVCIYDENNKYVSTSFSSYSQTPLRLENSNSSSKYWKMGFYNDASYPGYYLCKVEQSSWGWDMGTSKYWNDFQSGLTPYIGLYDLDSGSTFVFYSSDPRHLEHLSENGIVFEGEAPVGFKAYADSIRINDKDLVYNKSDKSYFFPLPESARDGEDFSATITWKNVLDDPTCNLALDGELPDAESGEIILSDVDCTQSHTLSIVKEGEGEVATATLHFTYLPIVEVNVASCNGSYYNTGTIRVTDSNYSGYDSTFIAAYKYRGATAQNYEKKSYAIKMRDADGNSVDREFFGLRDDNNWILDAMAIDKACMRNRVSTDLWNDFATVPYHQKWEKKARTGTRGRFVEVFLNGNYHGLYCMTEKMDRKQLKLKKFTEKTETSADTIHGTLYKSTDWTYETFMGHEQDSEIFPRTAPSTYDNNKRVETWCGYEIKYPDYEEEPIDWGPLWNAVNFVATATDSEFENNFSKYFDRPVVDDYYLFIELMLATDNHGKNMFFFNYDQQGETSKEKIGIAPWDLDGTWGRRWDGSSYYTAADQDFATFIWKYEHGMGTMFYRLGESEYLNWNLVLAQRYAKLRATYFEEESLKKRFTDYARLFSESGADTREEARWKYLHNDIQGDVEYICQWIDDRLETLDAQYNYVKPSTGIDQLEEKAPYIGVRGGKGCITVHVTVPVEIRIHDISGKLVRNEKLSEAVTTLQGFAPGVYIVAGKKVLVE